MAIDKVREYFKTYQMDDHILEFDVSSATVELAAEALQCEGKRIATVSYTHLDVYKRQDHLLPALPFCSRHPVRSPHLPGRAFHPGIFCGCSP